MLCISGFVFIGLLGLEGVRPRFLPAVYHAAYQDAWLEVMLCAFFPRDLRTHILRLLGPKDHTI